MWSVAMPTVHVENLPRQQRAAKEDHGSVPSEQLPWSNFFARPRHEVLARPPLGTVAPTLTEYTPRTILWG